jgi:hypothetical protein
MELELVFLLLMGLFNQYASASSSSCGQEPYKDLLFLSAYQPAQALCSILYPVHTTLQTIVHTSIAVRSYGQIEERSITKSSTTTARPHSTSTTTSVHRSSSTTPTAHRSSSTTTPFHSTMTSTRSTAPESSCTGTCSVWSSCTKKGGAFLSTLCGCMAATVGFTTRVIPIRVKTLFTLTD